MKTVKSVNITDTDYLSKTTKDYVSGAGKQNVFPPKPSLKLIYEKSLEKDFSQIQRNTLVKTLLSQYKNDNIELSKTSEVYKNIISLKNKNVFSCTTGQQIHIFLGPLFFIYKIKSLLKIAEIFNKENKKTVIVPIFWMATEDHDFDEISNIKLYGKEYKWNAEQGNAVGRILCKGLPELISKLENRADKTDQNMKLFSLLKKHYNEKKTLSTATRCILHELFEKNGLIIINPDDEELKKTASKIFIKEIENNVIFNSASEQYLLIKKAGYKPVLKPQKVNYFWLDNGKRQKITEYRENGYSISVNKKITLNEIKNHIGKISPNVLSRTIYQETILPNLVYVAGSTEIEYWLLLTKVFEKLELEFPVLIMRDSAIILNEKTYKDIEKLNIKLEELLNEIKTILKKTIKKESKKSIEIEKLVKKIYNDAELIKNEMINFGYDKSKVEYYTNQIKLMISKLENTANNSLINNGKSTPSNEKIIKIKEKFFTLKQERTDFFIEYPELLENIYNINFKDFEFKFHFLSR